MYDEHTSIEARRKMIQNHVDKCELSAEALRSPWTSLCLSDAVRRFGRYRFLWQGPRRLTCLWNHQLPLYLLWWCCFSKYFCAISFFLYTETCALWLRRERPSATLKLTENPESRDRLMKSPNNRKCDCQTNCHRECKNSSFDYLFLYSVWLYQYFDCWILIFWMNFFQRRRIFVFSMIFQQYLN